VSTLNTEKPNTLHPYEQLTPDCILDALEDVGFEPTGSLLALNSYENRVYQVSLEDGSFVIAKFYRPNRWSNEAILEEHAFSDELVQQEIPIVAPIAINGKTLFEFNHFRFAIFPRQGGRTSLSLIIFALPFFLAKVDALQNSNSLKP